MPREKLIARYVVAAVLPYVLLSLVLLTAVLLAQQVGRFAELALYTQVPFTLFLHISLATLPGVLVITLPVAVLAGSIIGFARMGSDSEIVAMRAAGVGTWSMLWPVLLLGLFVSGVNTYIQMEEAPRAMREIRKAFLQGALRKLDSPVEPRTFNTEIPGNVIYVRDGNKVEGSWGRVFIYAQEHDASTRIITARSGRIDSSPEKSELVLSDAIQTKLPAPESGAQESYVVDRLGQLRINIDTGRTALLQRLNQGEREPDELDWDDLRKETYSTSITQRRAGERTLHRRLALSVAPFLFAFVGGALGLRVRRGGRGLGVLLSLLVVVIYYLLMLLGESLSRTGALTPVVALWLASVAITLLGFAFLTLHRIPLAFLTHRRFRDERARASKTMARPRPARSVGALRSGFPSLLDVSVFRALASSFIVAFASLVVIFMIFTILELWRFIGNNRVGVGLVTKYLLFLMPLITVELFPATILVAVLITYALLARRNEAIAWWNSGQSVYRLMLPGLVFAVLAAASTWVIQERLMPSSNVRQDALRAQIRGGEARAISGTGKQWLATAESNRLYSYEFDERLGMLRDLTIYELDSEGVHLAAVTTGSVGLLTPNNHMLVKDADTLQLKDMQVKRQNSSQKELAGVESAQVFKPTIDKPSQLSAEGLSSYLRAAKRRGIDVSALVLALQRKYIAPFSVILMAFIGMPLALSFGRRGAIIALCLAVGVSVSYWGIVGGFQQLGNHGLLPPAVAAWAPPVIFAAAGTYFLSRIRT